MTTGMRTIIFPVSDLDRAKAVFGALVGAAPSMEAPYYVQFDVDGLQIGLDPSGPKQGLTGPVPYWTVDDIQTTLQTLADAGAQQLQGPQDVGGGMLIAVVTDADGNPIGLKQEP
jgi:predicted enzyme related to lactoylglutathione lyase